jgi:hypothetical protein
MFAKCTCRSLPELLAIVIANQGASSMAPRREQPSIARDLSWLAFSASSRYKQDPQ